MTTHSRPTPSAASLDRRTAYRRLVLAAARGEPLATVAHLGLAGACAASAWPAGRVCTVDRHEGQPAATTVAVFGTESRPDLVPAIAPGAPIEEGSPTTTAVATGRPCWSAPQGPGTVSRLAVPLAHGDTIGVIELVDDRPHEVDEAVLGPLREIAEVLGAAITRDRSVVDDELRTEWEQPPPAGDAPDPGGHHRMWERVELDRQRLCEAERIGSFGVWELLPGRELRWSEELCRIHGVPPDFLPTLESNLALVHPDDLGVVDAYVENLRADGSAAPVQYRIRRPSGEPRWVESHVRILDGNRVIGITRDITEQRAREQRDRLQGQITQTMAEGVILVASDGTIRYVNPQFAAMFGEEPSRMEGRLVWDFIVADQRPPPGTVTHPRPRDLRREVRHIRRDGTVFTTEAIITGMPIEEGETAEYAWLSVERDITEEKQHAAELERSNTELRRATRQAEEAQRLAVEANRAKTEFLSRMSHELRTPLNAVLGFAQLLGMEDLTDTQLDMIEQVLRAGRHLLLLVDEVLDIARLENGTMTVTVEPVDVAGAFHHARSLLDPLVRDRGVRIHDLAGADGPVPAVAGDRQRVVQILLNLLSNAVKYNEPRGEVRTRIERAADRVSIAVTDTGPGIAPEVLSRVFEPFDRLGAEQTGIEGTGIGLTVSRALAEQMGGGLTVRSVRGEGSTFILDLPIHATAR